MPDSSTCSVCTGSNLDKEPKAATNYHAQALQVPHCPTYNMDRFLQHNGDRSDGDYERPLPGLTEPQSEIDAEERMRRLLCTFDERFYLRGSPSGS